MPRVGGIVQLWFRGSLEALPTARISTSLGAPRAQRALEALD